MIRIGELAHAVVPVAARLHDQIDADAAQRIVHLVGACLKPPFFDRVEVIVRAAGAVDSGSGKDALEHRPLLAGLTVRGKQVRVGDRRAADVDVRPNARHLLQKSHDPVVA